MMVEKLKEAGIEAMVIEPPAPVLLSGGISGNGRKRMRSWFLKLIRKTSNFFKLFLLPT